MKIYDNKKCIRLNDSDFDTILDGTTAIVYTDYKNVYKIKRDYNKLYSEYDPREEFFRYLVDCNLDLNVINTPKGLLYDKYNNFIGTYTNYVDGKKDIRNYYKYLLLLKKNEFLNNFYLLKEVILTLSKYNIIACDVSPHNSIYRDGCLYHIDYGDFYREYDAYFDFQTVDLYIYNLLLYICRYSKLKIDKSLKYKESLTFIEKHMNDNDNVYTFIKKYN